MNTQLVRLLLVVLGTALPAPIHAQTCPANRPLRGDLGIAALRCTGPGASCAINLADGSDLRHSFAVEPVVAKLVDGSDSSLRIGDTLVAIDSLLITTAAAGRRLARLEPRVPVTVTVRRNGVIRQLILTPTPGCGINSLTVTTRR